MLSTSPAPCKQGSGDAARVMLHTRLIPNSAEAGVAGPSALSVDGIDSQICIADATLSTSKGEPCLLARNGTICIEIESIMCSESTSTCLDPGVLRQG
jgi:hypothetical protein